MEENNKKSFFDTLKKEKSGNWEFKVDTDIIKITNTYSEIKLYINDKLQDIAFGILLNNVLLTGMLTNGKSVKVKLGESASGFNCYIFIDNELVFND